MSARRRLDLVDAALEDARREARDAKLPPLLRARILAATRPAAESATPLARPVASAAPRARLVDLVLRAAAIAAAFGAVLLVAPVSLEAAEFDAKPIVEMNARLADSIARNLPSLDAADAELPDVGAASAWPLAAASAALLGAGLLLARKDGRR